uniref:Low-temperature-induced 65 kDa protein n=1 Tax=Phaseolus vulgaris TaxID=3885 RepID=V7BC42_PHAVU|nr:hypothetical protein PHAVU_007G069800g [Phaseolus vulgaris]ESW15399.1 hypothetical protein PHAVU_007G069800g [Phaseolus vulgaris]
MDSRVVQNEVHENDEHYPHILQVKAKAKKIKDRIKKHGHQVLDGNRECNEDQHNLDEDNLNEDEDMNEDTQVPETPIHESEDVKSVTPTSEQLGTLGKSGTDFGEEKAGPPKDNLDGTMELEEEPYSPGRPEAYTPPIYHTKVTHPIEEVKDEMEESFARMNVQDEPKSIPELNLQPTVVDSEYPHVDQFLPHLSAAMQTQYPSSESHEQFTQETMSPNINKNLQNVTDSRQTFNTITTTVEEHSCYEANTYRAISPKDVTASEAGSVEKDDRKDNVETIEEQPKSGDASNMAGSTAEYGKNIAHSLTQKLAPVYDKVAGVGSAVKSKVSGTSTGGVGTERKNEVKEEDKGVSVKDYLAEKLRPGEEDKALSEVISEALHKRKEEPVKNEHHGGDEKMRDDPGKGVVDKLKGVVGSWFSNSEGKVAGVEDLSKNTNSGGEVEQVNQVVGENKSSPIEEQETR